MKMFETADLYLSAFISLSTNVHPTFRVENQIVTFVFPLTPKLTEAIAEYHAGALVNAYAFSQRIKTLRAEMIMRKGT